MLENIHDRSITRKDSSIDLIVLAFEPHDIFHTEKLKSIHFTRLRLATTLMTTKESCRLTSSSRKFSTRRCPTSPWATTTRLDVPNFKFAVYQS